MVENPPPQDNMRMASPTCHAAVYQVPRCAFDDQVYTTHFASAGISQRQEVCYSGPPPRQPSPMHHIPSWFGLGTGGGVRSTLTSEETPETTLR